MTNRYPTRIGLALALATVVDALAIPAAARAAETGAPPDWIERYAAAHPYGQGVASTTHPAGTLSLPAGTAPDWIERFALAHPYGDVQATAVDGRSADTRDAAANAQQASSTPSDGRSPDTLEAAAAPQPVVLAQDTGFHWGDAGIGAGFAGGLLLVAAAGTVWLRRPSRQRIQTT